ncbi:MAG: LacI family DNA-binding transcriptional regulator [Calditrichia bacterium]
MKTNIVEIAKRAGVSIATVSRALNKNGSVREETRQRILQIANELNYKPNPIARSLSRRKTDTIGVILPELVDEFFTELIRGIDEEAYRDNHYIMVSSSHSQRNILEPLFDFMLSGRVDGVILMAPTMQNEINQLIHNSRRPVVLINVCKQLNDVVSINIDNQQGAFALVEHLISHGYKKIGMILGAKGNCDADERFLGYQEALKKYDIPLKPEYIVQGDFTVRSGYYGFIRLMNQGDKPEAVFATNDMMALGVYDAAKNLGIRIPDDVAVGGFDDIYLSHLITPRLTTVHVPIAELGTKAVRYLLNMINGEVDPKKPYREELTTGLVIGGSCGCSLQVSSNFSK